MSSKKIKYWKTYLKFGFIFTVNNGLDIPVCVFCEKTLVNNSMKPSLLTRHLERTFDIWRGLEIQRLDFFMHRATVFKQKRLDRVGMFLQHTNASLEVSYEVSFLVQSKLSLSAENVTKFWWYIRTYKVFKGYRRTRSLGTPTLVPLAPFSLLKT